MGSWSIIWTHENNLLNVTSDSVNQSLCPTSRTFFIPREIWNTIHMRAGIMSDYDANNSMKMQQEVDWDFGFDYSLVTCSDWIIIWGGTENPYNAWSYTKFKLTRLTPMMSSHIAHSAIVIDDNKLVVISGEEN